MLDSTSSHLGWAGFAVTAAVFTLAIYIVCFVIYQVFFHPLAAYPGPLVAKFTDLYSLYHSWAGDRHVDFLNQHAIYGPVFRYGPNRLSFNTHTALHIIHGTKANIRKADFYHGFDSPSGANLLGTISKVEHSRKRRILAFAFSDKAINSMEQYMLANIRLFCEKLASTTEPLNISQWCTYLAGDILGDLAFGKSFEALTTPTNRGSLETISKSGKFLLVTGAAYNIRHSIISKILFRDLLNGRLEHWKFATERAIQRTRMSSSDRKDFYHYLMEAKNPDTDEKYSPQETWVEAHTLVAAGSDTTSLVLSATFFYLSRNPSVLRKVQKEVRETFKGQDVEAIQSGPQLNSCRYLRACLDESMRMTPPVPGILPRLVLPGGIVIDDHIIPEGVEVGTPHYALFHNPAYFPDSFSYRPERWILPEDACGEEIAAFELANRAFAPFSIGTRNCIGKNMAVMEMMTTMARVLKCFEFEGSGELGGEYVVKDHFVCEKDGPMLSFTPAKE